MTQRRPKRLTPAQLRFLALKRKWTKIRLNAWRTMPEKMEAIRKQATKVAAERKQRHNDAIREEMKRWPKTLSTTDLREHIDQAIEYEGKVTSLIYRMRRHGMIDFQMDGLWHNLCHLPAE